LAPALKIISSSPEETKQVGITLSKQLKPGTAVAFFGVLGAGKTCFIKGICEGLGRKEIASSASFIMVNEYPGEFPVYHLDLYRLDNLQELLDLGYEEYFYGEGVCLIEWAEKAGELLPSKRWDVELKILSENLREILVTERTET
jgi:tRNA threonylcarbamoyladenosine biosynthesis protein TsaE